MEIGTCLVCSLAGTAMLPKTVVLFRCLIVVALLAVIAVIGPVEESGNTSQPVKMVFYFKKVNFLRSIITDTIFVP